MAPLKFQRGTSQRGTTSRPICDDQAHLLDNDWHGAWRFLSRWGLPSPAPGALQFRFYEAALGQLLGCEPLCAKSASSTPRQMRIGQTSRLLPSILRLSFLEN